MAADEPPPPPPHTQWTMVPKELLELILARLDFADHARFRSVCSWWRSVAMDNPPANKSLALVVSDDPDRLVRRYVTSLRPSWVTAKFIGCLGEWLVALIDGREMFLLNTASGEQIPLPRLPPPYPPDSDYKAVLSSPPPSANCTIVLRESCTAALAFCRLGDDSFTMFHRREDPRQMIRDVVFYKEQLYAVDGRGRLKVFDSGLNSKPTELTAVAALPPSVDYSLFYGDLPGSCHDHKLLAAWFADQRRTTRAKVFELDTADSRWVEVESLGDHNALLFNGDFSISLSVRGHEGLQGNCVFRGYHGYCEKLSPWIDEFAFFSEDEEKEKEKEEVEEEVNASRPSLLVFFSLFSVLGFWRMED